MFLTTEDTPWHKILQAPHLQVILTVMLCYFVSAMQIGVVLYRRKVYAYQILGKVLRSTICFGVLSGVVLELGRFMDAWSYFYLTFLGLLFISLSVFRILMRWGLKRYRSKGGNLRYVVLVGSSENNRELYYELYNPQIQISAESGTKRSIFRQKNKTKRSKKRLHTTLIKPEQKVNEDLCSGFILS